MNFEVFANSYRPAYCFHKGIKSNLRAALLGSRQLKLCLSHDMEVLDVPGVDYANWVDGANVDFLLIESCWKDSTGDWVIGHPDAQERHRTFLLIDLFRKSGIPVIFWHTIDASYAQFYTSLIEHVDYVFCADLKVKPAYTRDNDKEVFYLPPAVQPALHNPFRLQQHGGLADFEPFLHISWADILEYPSIATKLDNAKYYGGLAVLETDWKMRSEKLEDSGRLRADVRGYVSYLQLIQAFKSHPILYMPLPSLSSNSRRAWRSLEALSCGMHVVFEGAFELPELDIKASSITSEGSVDDLDKYHKELRYDDFNFKARSHTTRRNLWSNHTYRNRLNSIAKKLGISSGIEKMPLASVIIVTKRPELLDNCLAIFRKQNYESKELIIVLNSPDKAVYELAVSRIGPCADIRVMQVHNENNIGVCLNLGISQATGNYWLKMDDDDYYGENYLADTMRILVDTGASLCAKPPVYVYFESTGEIFQRDVLSSENVFKPNSHGAGATFSGTVEIVKRQPFSTDRRGDVDSEFIKRLTSAGEVVVLGDRFNFVIHRAAQQGFHTWRLPDSDLKLHAKLLGDRSKLEAVNL